MKLEEMGMHRRGVEATGAIAARDFGGEDGAFIGTLISVG